MASTVKRRVGGMYALSGLVRRCAMCVPVAALLCGACTTRDATRDTEPPATIPVEPDGGIGDGAGPPALISATTIPDSFTVSARAAYDLTGNGHPEAIIVHAHGPRADTATVDLVVLSANADTLYHDRWNAQRYFEYEPRGSFTEQAATAKVVQHLQRLLSDSAFTADGPSARLRSATPGGIDRDAVRYDLKEAAVRAKHSLPMPAPLQDAIYDELGKAPVTGAAIDSLAQELRTMPTFTYYAGGEVTNTVAWSNVKKRFIRIFSCC